MMRVLKCTLCVSLILMLSFAPVVRAADRFNLLQVHPNSDLGHYLFVQESKTLPQFKWNLGGFALYYNNLLEVDNQTVTTTRGGTTTVNTNRVAMTNMLFQYYYGSFSVFDRVNLMFDMPFYLYYKYGYTVNSSLNAQYYRLSPGDLRLAVKFCALDLDKFPIGLAFLTAVSFPTGKEEHFLGEVGYSVEENLIIESRLMDKLRMSLNAAFQTRKQVAIGDLYFRDYVKLALAANYSLRKDISLIAELETQTAANNMFGAKNTTPTEFRVGARWYPEGGDVYLGGGGSAGILYGKGMPRASAFINLGYMPKHEADKPMRKRIKPTPVRPEPVTPVRPELVEGPSVYEEKQNVPEEIIPVHPEPVEGPDVHASTSSARTELPPVPVEVVQPEPEPVEVAEIKPVEEVPPVAEPEEIAVPEEPVEVPTPVRPEPVEGPDVHASTSSARTELQPVVEPKEVVMAAPSLPQLLVVSPQLPSLRPQLSGGASQHMVRGGGGYHHTGKKVSLQVEETPIEAVKPAPVEVIQPVPEEVTPVAEPEAVVEEKVAVKEVPPIVESKVEVPETPVEVPTPVRPELVEGPAIKPEVIQPVPEEVAPVVEPEEVVVGAASLPRSPAISPHRGGSYHKEVIPPKVEEAQSQVSEPEPEKISPKVSEVEPVKPKIEVHEAPIEAVKPVPRPEKIEPVMVMSKKIPPVIYPPSRGGEYRAIYITLFGINRARVSASNIAVDWAVEHIKQNKVAAIDIRGWTDKTGPRWYNKILALRRAESVARYMKHELGFWDAIKVTILAIGEDIFSSPERARRVEIIIK